MTTHRNYAAWLLDLLGVAIIMGEVFRNWFWGHQMEWWVVLVGATFGFVGFYLTNPPGAITAGTFIVDSGVKIIGVVRSGRRASDPVVPQVVAPPMVKPEPPPAGGE